MDWGHAMKAIGILIDMSSTYVASLVPHRRFHTKSSTHDRIWYRDFRLSSFQFGLCRILAIFTCFIRYSGIGTVAHGSFFFFFESSLFTHTIPIVEHSESGTILPHPIRVRM